MRRELAQQECRHIFCEPKRFGFVLTMFRPLLMLMLLAPGVAFALSQCPPSLQNGETVKCGPVPIEYLAAVYSAMHSTAHACTKLDPDNAKQYEQGLAVWLNEDKEAVAKAQSYPGIDEILKKERQAIDDMSLDDLRRRTHHRDCEALGNRARKFPD